VEPTPKSGFETFAENYAKGNQRRVDDIVKYGGETSGLGSRTADLLVSGGVSDSPGLRAAALAGDIVFDPSNLIGIPAVGAAAKTGARVAQLAPDTRQLYLNSLLGRLYHGAKQTPPAVLGNRGPQPQNWFQADTFLTTSKPLARTYGSEGLYRARVPLDVAENMNVMDIYNDPERLLQIANSPRVSEILGREGANVVRHQSGQGIGAGTANVSRAVTNPFTGRVSSRQDRAIESPVYAFTEPAGIQMQRVADVGGDIQDFINRAGYNARYTVQDLIDRIRKTGRYDPDDVL
jgi:hypothetical protein